MLALKKTKMPRILVLVVLGFKPNIFTATTIIDGDYKSIK